MSIFLIGSQKGGVGKTTICASFACKLANMGNDVCIVDADSQQSIAKWCQYRNYLDEKVSVVHNVSATGNIAKTLIDLDTRYDHIVVDVAGRDSLEMRSALTVSHVFISPFRPSQVDIDSIPHLIELFEQVAAINPKLTGFLVQNLCPTLPSLKDADKAENALDGVNGLTLMSVRLCDRQGHRSAFSNGYGVEEWQHITGKNSDIKAAQEITFLVEEALKYA